MASLDNFRLIVFRKVAEQLSFRKAAELLFLTQPAVSLQIKALEEELGVQLFDRTGSHISLTAAGQLLLKYSERSSRMLDQAVYEIAALTGESGGHLALGASTTIAQYVLPPLLGEFSRRYPRIQSTLIGGNTEHIVEAIESRKIDLGFIEGPALSHGVKTKAFLKDELVLIVSSGHEWAERASIKCSELRTMPLLMRERGSGTRRIVERALSRCGLKQNAFRVGMELDSTEAIKSAVEAGLGAGFVSRWAIAKDLRIGSSFKIVTVEGLNTERNFLIVHTAGPEPTGPAMQFAKFIFANSPARKVPSDPQRHPDKKRK